MSHLRLHQLLIALATAIGACTPMSRSDSAGPRASYATVAVQNNFTEPFAIYAVSTGGASFRLGAVASAEKGTMSVPGKLLTEPGVRLVARPIGPGRALNLPCAPIIMGSTVDLVLDRGLALTNCWVR